MMKIKERCDIGVDNENYIATSSAGTTIRPAQWNEFFTMHGDTTISTFSGSCMERDAIDK